MSVVVTSRIYWTQFENVEYQEKNGKTIKIGKLAAKSVMSAIGDSADDFGENSWQGFETIAEKSSVERRSVIRITRGLISCGWLSVKEVSRYGTNNFSIVMDKLGYPPKKRSVNGRPKSGDVQSPLFQAEPETGDSGAETGDSGAETGDQESPYPSFNHPLSKEIKSVDAKSASTPVKSATASPHRSDARKLGDPMDGILKYGRDALDPAAALTARIQEYPPELQDVLCWVCNAQGWAASVIPAQERRGKINPDYLWWIRELKDLYAQLNGFGETAIKAASLQSADITISHPGALTQTLISVVGRLRKKALPPPPSEPTPFERAMRGLPSLQ